MWIAIGLSLVYNITFNHFFSFFLKPGSPEDLEVNFYFLYFGFRILKSSGRKLRNESIGQDYIKLPPKMIQKKEKKLKTISLRVFPAMLKN